MGLLLGIADVAFSAINWIFVLGMGYLLGNVIVPLCGRLVYNPRCLRVRGTGDENDALDAALRALHVAGSLAPDAGFDAAASIFHVARERALPTDLVRLYVVDRSDPLPPPHPATAHGAAGPVAVMTLPMIRRRWPRLFDKDHGQRAAGTSEALALLVTRTTHANFVVVHHLAVGQATLDAEFGPQDDPVVARVRALVAPLQ